MLRTENGITLVALIITIIVLVILAAVSISTVYNTKIMDYAVNGTADYASQAVRENEIMQSTTSYIDDKMASINAIINGSSDDGE